MARPKTASDEEILQAAHRVMLRRGHEGFTLSEVAREVGLTRSAIIQRFDSTQSLKITLTAKMVSLFEGALNSLPVSCSGDGLVALVEFIGGMIPDRKQLGAFMQSLQSGIHDKDLVNLESQRSMALHQAISDRMPIVAIDHDSAVLAFMANIGGSLSQWQVWSDVDAKTFLVERTCEWLRLAGIPFEDAESESVLRSNQPFKIAL